MRDFLKATLVLLRLAILYSGLVEFESLLQAQTPAMHFLALTFYVVCLVVAFGRVTSLGYLDKK